MCSKIILARDKEEEIASRWNPITREIFAALLESGAKSATDSLKGVVADWFDFIRIAGLQCAEYAQKTQIAVNEHEYPSGKRVVKAFLLTYWKFYNKKGNVMHVHPLNDDIRTFPKKMKGTYQIQKNGQNGQSITLVSDDDHPDICPVRAAYRIFLRAKCLGQSNSQPMAIFVNKHGDTKYLMGNKISDVLHSIARAVHPDLSEDEIKRLSLHSGQVWALVLLDEAGMNPDFMKSRLRWMGESYRLYLHDTLILQQKHVNTLKKDSEDQLRLLGRNCDILPNIVPEDNEMGEY
jgi:hypothetical protein